MFSYVQLMYQRNRNLFSFLAVLCTAGLIAGTGGLFLLFANQLGGGTQLVSNPSEDIALREGELAESDVNRDTWGNEVATVGTHQATVLSIATNLNGTYLASGSYDSTVKLWNKTDGAEASLAHDLAHNGRVNDLVFTPNGQQLVTGSGAGNLRVWDVASGELISILQGESGRITSLAIDKAGTLVASGSSNGTLKVWQLSDTGTIANPVVLTTVGPQINTLIFDPTDSNVVLSGDQDGIVQRWDIAQTQPIQTLSDDADRIIGIDITQDGQYVASGSYDRTIRIWDLTTGDRVQSLDGHDFVVSDVSFTPDGRLLASSSYDESVKVWDWTEAQELCTLDGHSGFVYAVDFIDDGLALLSGGYDGTVKAWDLQADANESCLR
ncbi:MAG: WD40 repeat domain-containing protein [Cyanobacteria bacterium J06607_10]